MSLTPGDIDVQVRRHGTTAQVVVNGEVDIASIARVAEPLGKALTERPETVVLNLEGSSSSTRARFP